MRAIRKMAVRARNGALLLISLVPNKLRGDLHASEKDKAVSEDKRKKAHQDLQKLTDNMVTAIDEAGSKREKEILEIG